MPSPYKLSQLITNINAEIPDNTTRLISAEDVRTNLIEVAESLTDIVGDTGRDYASTITKSSSAVGALYVDGNVAITGGLTVNGNSVAIYPSQAGNSGSTLITNGSTVSWTPFTSVISDINGDISDIIDDVTAIQTGLANYVPTSRTIATTSPLLGGGDLSANRTISIPVASSGANGYLSSTDWTTFNNKMDDSAAIDLPNYQLLDSSVVLSVDWDERKLYDTSGSISVAWGSSRTLHNSSGTYVVDWQSSIMYDNSGNSSIAWNDRVLYDSTGDSSVDWQNNQLIDGGQVRVDWLYGSLKAGGVDSVGWDGRILYDSTSNDSIDWNNRYCFDSSEVNSVDWNLRRLNKGGVGTVFDWEAMYCYDASTLNSIDWSGRQLFDTGGSVVSINWASRYLYDASGGITVAWDDLALIDSAAVYSCDWGNRILHDNTGAESINYNSSTGVGIGTGTVATKLHVFSSTATDGLTLENTNAGASGSLLNLYHNSASPANSDETGIIRFSGKSSTGVTRNYAEIRNVVTDTTNASENNIVKMYAMYDGALTEACSFGSIITGAGVGFKADQISTTNIFSTGAMNFYPQGSYRAQFTAAYSIINPGSTNHGFVVRGWGEANTFFVDGQSGLNYVGIGVASTLAAKLHVQAADATKVQRIETRTAANDYITEDTIQQKITTTDTTITYSTILTSATDTVYLVESTVIGRRTGGASGAAGDSCSFKIAAQFRNNSGSLVKISDTLKTIIWKSNDNLDTDFNVSSTNIRWQVSGLSSNNYTWHATHRIYPLST